MPRVSDVSEPTNDNPEWTKERVRKAVRLGDLPSHVQKVLAPTGKQPVRDVGSVCLEPDVLAAAMATGEDWQREVNHALREYFLRTKPAA